MKYIDKSKNLPQGDEIIDQLLSESWNAEESRYIGADYDGLRAPLYKVPLTDLLLDEQRMTCCYCMKVLQSTDVTIEHIIPQGITIDDMENYLVVRELTDHLIHKDRFDRTVEQQHPDKYPHDIAYSNLLASCYSQEHCNHFRGSKEIKPFFFDPDIELKVKYDVAGLIDCEEYLTSFENIGLDSPSLNTIRKIWRKLSRRIGDPHQITSEDLDVELYSLIDDPDYLMIIETLTPSMFSELKEYRWFHGYYSRMANNL